MAAENKRSLSGAHKEAIKKSMTGKKSSAASRAALIKYLEERHHNRYEWILINPAGVLTRTNAMRAFCQLNGLNYSSLRYKAQTGDSRPITRGLSKGWTVFAVKKSQN